jgi:hypothetical protein
MPTNSPETSDDQQRQHADVEQLGHQQPRAGERRRQSAEDAQQQQVRAAEPGEAPSPERPRRARALIMAAHAPALARGAGPAPMGRPGSGNAPGHPAIRP